MPRETPTARSQLPRRLWWPLAPGGAAGRVPAAPVAREIARGGSPAAPVDPLGSPRMALAGRVVAMDARDSVRGDAVVYVEKGCIVGVRDRRQAAPEGFRTTPVTETGGTIFPGLVELHNHLSYNALPLWAPVPKAFDNRDQWADVAEYRRLVSGPMAVVGRRPELLPALVRYVEGKCLLAGVTTSQGIRLSSNSGVSRYYRGIVRNVEQTREAALPEAQTRIADVDARDARAFKEDLVESQGRRCHLLHLSEGLTRPDRPDSAARRHFLALEVAPGDWAITDALAGIHAAGLLPADFERLAERGGSIVWSPLSNLLLYGQTARVEAARAAGVRIGLGGDWSPSGSKNLLGELKVAWLYSQAFLDGRITAREIVAMATRTAAQILKWDAALGSVEPGKRADLLVVAGTGGDPYESLVRARETSVHLVVINGVPRYGTRELMDALGGGDQTIRVGGETRRLFLAQETVPGEVAAVPLATARSTLAGAFRDIRKLAREVESGRETRAARVAPAADAAEPIVWTLALDETRGTGLELRPRLPYAGPRDFTGPEPYSRRAARAAASARLSEILRPIRLDPLTVADDDDFVEQVASQPNVPEAVRRGLRGFY